jgi:DNA-binding NtrC family response regulator
MLELLRRVAPSDSTVLLLGESGTGKEMLARALHDSSHRALRPFVPVDCSGLNESLFESELFGHERGAFTGAVGRKRGLCEAAHLGTLFLDEIGDIPVPQQVKLLRLIETNTFRRVGSVDELRADFRLICATHRDLNAMVNEGTFRRDLYYRISSFPVRLPPLRERAGDIPLLVSSFLELEPCRHVRHVSDGALAKLRAYPFPGNIRELRNVIQRACLLVDGDTLLPEHLPEEIRNRGIEPALGGGVSELVPLATIEEQYLRWAVMHFAGDRAALARKLGISERTLYRRIGRLHVDGRHANH